MLAPTDYEIIEAEDGEQALAAIAKQRPDLILMDRYSVSCPRFVPTTAVYWRSGKNWFHVVGLDEHGAIGSGAKEARALIGNFEIHVSGAFLLANARQLEAR
jgi:DNA-binding NarL/FixJ family response regulator